MPSSPPPPPSKKLVLDERTPVQIANTQYTIPKRWATAAIFVRLSSDPNSRWVADSEIVQAILIHGGDPLRAIRRMLLSCKDKAWRAKDYLAVQEYRTRIELFEVGIDLSTISDFAAEATAWQRQSQQLPKT